MKRNKLLAENKTLWFFISIFMSILPACMPMHIVCTVSKEGLGFAVI